MAIYGYPDTPDERMSHCKEIGRKIISIYFENCLLDYQHKFMLDWSCN